jgi:hypothetical protein
MKITMQLVFLMWAVSLRSAWLIRRACRPGRLSPISPSSSALGVSAATESTTIRSTAPERTRLSTISRACSPVSGWLISRSCRLTPRFCAYWMSSACSASTKAHCPPVFCISAMTCKVSVVLPTGFRAVDFDHTPARQAAHAQRDVQAERAGGHHLDVFDHLAFAQAHDGALAKLLFNLGQCNLQGLGFFRIGGGEGFNGCVHDSLLRFQ